MLCFAAFWLFSAAFISGCVLGQRPISCRNEQGDPVDWYIVYKLPREKGYRYSNGQLRGSGFEYLYMDGSTSGQWKRSQVSIRDQGHAVAYTLNQSYSNLANASVFRLLYNDESPNGTVSFTKGHTKGSLVFDSASGFWLIHSVPKFPPKDAYGYPPTGAKYGQTFFCITFPYSMLGEIANQLFYYNPYIFDWALPDAMARENEVLQKVVKGQIPKTGPFFRTKAVSSTAGVALTSFAKYKKWGADLYTDLVAPTVSRGLYTETWQNGRGDIGSNCTAVYHVCNIASVSLMSDLSFSNHEDHSKWAVSNETVADGNQIGQWICIGDINRQKEQFLRSGGTMCMQNTAVWKAFRGSIQRYEECPIDL